MIIQYLEYKDLVDDLRYQYISDDGNGPEVEDLILFLCRCPELCRKTKTFTMFRLGCLCVSHVPTAMPFCSLFWPNIAIRLPV